MQVLTIIILLSVAAYLTGSIPTSVWVGKLLHNTDVREHGSGNAGATNTMRVLGLKTGTPVLIFDMFKGWMAVKYTVFFEIFNDKPELLINTSILLGISAIIGHIFPLFAGFKGGKGVATTFGVLLALHPLATLSGAAVFFIVLFITKFVSASSIIAGISFPLWTMFLFDSQYQLLNIFTVLISLLIIVTHFKNLKRLIKGEENKAEFLFNSKD